MVSQSCDGPAGGEGGKRRYLPGNSGSGQTDVPVLDRDEQGLDRLSPRDLGNEFSADAAVADRQLRGDTRRKEHAGLAVLLLSFFSGER